MVELPAAIKPTCADVGDALHLEGGTKTIVVGLGTLPWELALVKIIGTIKCTVELHRGNHTPPVKGETIFKISLVNT